MERGDHLLFTADAKTGNRRNIRGRNALAQGVVGGTGVGLGVTGVGVGVSVGVETTGVDVDVSVSEGGTTVGEGVSVFVTA